MPMLEYSHLVETAMLFSRKEPDESGVPPLPPCGSTSPNAVPDALLLPLDGCMPSVSTGLLLPLMGSSCESTSVAFLC